MKFIEVPTIFLSYAEDNADQNYGLLLQQNPSARRVHGVKGFEAAHRKASEVAKQLSPSYPCFITVDGDNETMPDFWHLFTEDIPREYTPQHGSFCLSWNAYNPMTGLCYGNGGLKMWSHRFVEELKTHENAEEAVVDFCWRENYTQLARIYSTTRPYGSERQAFTAGFREGAKMPLVGGKQLDSIYETTSKAYSLNLQRLVTWCSVGAHVEHGPCAYLGALYGFYAVHVTGEISLRQVSDLDFIKELWTEQDIPTPAKMREGILAKTGIEIPVFGPKQSRFIVDRTRPTNLASPFERESWPSPIDVKF